MAIEDVSRPKFEPAVGISHQPVTERNQFISELEASLALFGAPKFDKILHAFLTDPNNVNVDLYTAWITVDNKLVEEGERSRPCPWKPPTAPEV